jgi:AbrB family looped-hinge helix DNA binding protein
MKELLATVSSKGQVTIPAEVRRHLRVSQGDKITFVLADEGRVEVKAAKYSSVAELRGAAGKLEKPLTWEEIERIAHEDRVEEITHNK